MNNEQKNQSFIERCYKDSHGKVTLMQPPNVPLLVWLASRLGLYALPHHFLHARNLLEAASYGALFTWAWLEVFKGSNYLRQLLGLLVIISLIAGKF